MIAKPNPDQIRDIAGPLERVQRLARPYRLLAEGAQRLSGDTGESLLASLMVELDETILPRQLKLETNTGRSVVLRVTGRRLLGIDANVDEARNTQSVTAGEMLDDLQQVFHGATMATLCSLRIDRANPGSDPGIAISAIIAAGGLLRSVPAVPDSVLDSVPELFKALTGQITAWLMLDSSGNKVEKGGDSAQLNRLVTLVREGLEDIEIQMAHSLTGPNEPGCVMLSSGGTNGLTLLYARSQHGGLLALLPTSKISCVLPAWRAFYHGD